MKQTTDLEGRVNGFRNPPTDEAQRVFRNPLDDATIRKLMGHIGHDIRKPLNVMSLMYRILNKDPGYLEAMGFGLDVIQSFGQANVSHVGNTLVALEGLARRDVNFETITAKGVEEIINENKAAISRNSGYILVDVHNLSDFKTDKEKLKLALYTLMENSKRKIPSGIGEIIVTATDYDTDKQGKLPELAYRNPITPIRGIFPHFKVIDNGKGFVKGTKLYLNTDIGQDPNVTEHFGLWLVRYISEVLRSHFYARIHIKDSETGGEVALFHPANIEAMYDRAALNPMRRWARDQIATRAQLYGRIAQAYGSIAHNAHKGSTK